MKQKLDSIGVLSLAKISALVYGIMGLIFLPFLLAFGFAGMLAGKSDARMGGVALVIMAIMLPLLYAAMGFIVGALSAAIYNVCARWIGGIEIELSPASGAAMSATRP